MQGKLLAVFTVCFMLLAISIASQEIDADTDVDNPWPFVGGDLQNTGRSDHDTSHVDGDILWNETIADALVPSDTSPVLDHEDNMYFSGGNIIISLDSSGERRWEYFFADGELTAPGLGADGTVYVGARTVNSLIALDREDGSVLWTFETIGNVTTAPVINNDGAIYFATHIKGEESSRVYSIGTDGNQRWVFDMPKVDNSTKVNARVAVGSNGWIYFGSFDNYVYALNQHGELEWKTDPAPAWGTTTQIFSSPAIDEGRVYVGTINGIAALDAYNGESIWHFPDERHEEFEFGDQVSVWASPAIGQGGRIYFGCTYTIPPEQAYTNPVRMGRIYALYPNGDVRWHMDTQNIMMSATPVVGKEGTIYMGTNDRAVYAFEPSGTILWNRSIARVIDSSPAIGSDGTVYFVTGGPIPIVYAFSGDKTHENIDGTNNNYQNMIIISGVAIAVVVSFAAVHLYRKKDRK